MQGMIFTSNGLRKYMTISERNAFLAAAQCFEPDTLTLCWVLSSTGCRISEALSLRSSNIDREAKMIIFESLKKRRKGIYRAVPVPAEVITMLEEIHGEGPHNIMTSDQPLWPFTRMTAYRRVRKVMDAAGITGAHAMPKGLRHAFGVTAIQSQVPLNLVQRWLGHADMRTTAIYANATGPEERSIATRMWRQAALQAKDARIE